MRSRVLADSSRPSPWPSTTVRYVEQAGGRLGLEIFPEGRELKSYNSDSLVQAKIVGEPYPGGFAQGHTMRNAHGFRLEQRDGARTTLRNSAGHRIEHRLLPRDGIFEVRTTFFNDTKKPVGLEMLSSFSLGGITGKLRVHRFRSVWSAEGRLDTQTVEGLQLEKSWAGILAVSERFGQVGTLPVRKWFPFVAIEDAAAGIVWGAQIAWAGSWQLEIYRRDSDLCISGGLADREFGHWLKWLEPGESLEAPPAFIACVAGTLDDLCDRFLGAQRVDAPALERELPIAFNEWCTSWGKPKHDEIVAIAQRLRDTPVRYLVIDAGWYQSEKGRWYSEHGDWRESAAQFPDGIVATAAAIREQGLIPGLWFEFETCGEDSEAFSMSEHLLKRDGVPITVNGRRFWDLNDPWVIEYLSQRVIELLKRGGFGYLKIDYNETLGIGTDDPDGLRQQVLASYEFLSKIRRELPDLTIENCASGGHRLEPSMLALTALSSFSDAHESLEIPIIAASLQRLVRARQSQIWAVLRKADSDRRLSYSLAAGFLGRLCLSGDVTELNPAQWELVLDALELYQRAVPIIRHGTSRVVSHIGESWRKPTGWQAVVRTWRDRALVVAHTFESAPPNIELPQPEGKWQILGQFPNPPLAGDFSARVLLLERSS